MYTHTHHHHTRTNYKVPAGSQRHHHIRLYSRGQKPGGSCSSPLMHSKQRSTHSAHFLLCFAAPQHGSSMLIMMHSARPRHTRHNHCYFCCAIKPRQARVSFTLITTHCSSSWQAAAHRRQRSQERRLVPRVARQAGADEVHGGRAEDGMRPGQVGSLSVLGEQVGRAAREGETNPRQERHAPQRRQEANFRACGAGARARGRGAGRGRVGACACERRGGLFMTSACAGSERGGCEV